jgi:hypothetical protein
MHNNNIIHIQKYSSPNIVIQHTFIKKAKKHSSNTQSPETTYSSFEEAGSENRNLARFTLEIVAEIESIFSQVYSTHEDVNLTAILSDTINKRIYIDNEMTYVFCYTLLKQISLFIKQKKESILLDPNFQRIKEEYITLKTRVTNTIKLAPTDEIKRVIINNNWLKGVQNYCEDNESQIYAIVKELFNIYGTISCISERLDCVFKNPIYVIQEVFNIEFSVRDLQIEEFYNVIIKDEFIRSLIVEIKQKDDIKSFKLLKNIIEQIENEINNSMRFWKILSDWSKKVVVEDTTNSDLGDLRTDVTKLHDYLSKTAK